MALPELPLRPGAMPAIAASDALYARALDLIPAQTQTLAKGPVCFVDGVAPKFLKRGKGSRVWDVDGTEFVDLVMGVGPLSLGYAYDEVDEAIRAQLADGITFSLPHALEVEVAELVRGVIRNAEHVRFAKTGAEATSAAVRVARAVTGRDKVLTCGYHGWHDWTIGTTDRSAGVPRSVRDLVFTFEYNDLGSVQAAIWDDVAAVILEPVTFQPPQDDFLQRLRKLCTDRGVALIFDEMWTGFRLALGGAQEAFDVVPDLACYSKAVANGMPIALLTGKAEFMQALQDDVFFFSTFGGEALSLAAAKKTVEIMQREDVVGHIHRTSAALRDGYDALCEELGLEWTRADGLDYRTLVAFDAVNGQGPLLVKSLMQQEMLRRGVLWSGFHQTSYSHTGADLDHVLTAYRDALPVVAKAVDAGDVAGALRGKPLSKVFRKTTKFHTKPRPA